MGWLWKGTDLWANIVGQLSNKIQCCVGKPMEAVVNTSNTSFIRHWNYLITLRRFIAACCWWAHVKRLPLLRRKRISGWQHFHNGKSYLPRNHAPKSHPEINHVSCFIKEKVGEILSPHVLSNFVFTFHFTSLVSKKIFIVEIVIFKKAKKKNHILASFIHAFMVFSIDSEIEQKKKNCQFKML